VREASRENGAGARAGDVIEVLAQRLADQPLDLAEDRQRQDTADAAAVERQQPTRPSRLIACRQRSPKRRISHSPNAL